MSEDHEEANKKLIRLIRQIAREVAHEVLDEVFVEGCGIEEDGSVEAS